MRSRSLDGDGALSPMTSSRGETNPETARKEMLRNAIIDRMAVMRESEYSYGLPTLFLFISSSSEMYRFFYLRRLPITLASSTIEKLFACCSDLVIGLGGAFSIPFSAKVPLTLRSLGVHLLPVFLSLELLSFFVIRHTLPGWPPLVVDVLRGVSLLFKFLAVWIISFLQILYAFYI